MSSQMIEAVSKIHKMTGVHVNNEVVAGIKESNATYCFDPLEVAHAWLSVINI